MSHLPPLTTLHELLKLLNIKACGQLSQNFLLQPWSIKGLVNCAESLTNTNVLEVGPGPGGITRYILQQKPHHLAVVEIDRRFLTNLQHLKTAAELLNTKMDIYNQDILKFNYENVFSGVEKFIHPEQAWNMEDVGKNELENRKIHIIGNLPFNISTILLCRWLHDISERRGLWQYAKVPLTLTFQEAVGHRLRAEIFDSERSRLSILSQSLCEVKMMRTIPGTAFLPKAKVDAAVVHLVPRSKPLIEVPFPYLNKFVKAVFQFKTKTLINGIESLFPPDLCKLVIRLFSVTRVDPGKYPIEVSMDEFKSMTETYHEMCTDHPDIFPYDFRHTKNDIHYRERKKMQRIILDGATLNSEFVKSAVQHIDREMSHVGDDR